MSIKNGTVRLVFTCKQKGPPVEGYHSIASIVQRCTNPSPQNRPIWDCTSLQQQPKTANKVLNNPGYMLCNSIQTGNRADRGTGGAQYCATNRQQSHSKSY